MSSIGDLSVNITADTGDFSAGMREVRAELDNTITVIHKQQASWSELANTSIEAVGKMTPAVVEFSAGLLKMFAVKRLIAYATGWGTLALAVGGAATAYRLLKSDSEAAEEVARESLPQYEALGSSYQRLKESLGELGSAIVAPFSDGTAAVIGYLNEFNPIPFLAMQTAKVFDATSISLNSLTRFLGDAKATATTFAFVLASFADANAAAAFHEQGQELVAMARASATLTKELEGQRPLFGFLRQAQEQAAAATQNAAEVARIGSLLTIESVENEIRSLQERSAAAIRNGEADDEWKKQTQALFMALEKQRQGIKDGTIVDREAEAAKNAAAQAAEDAARRQQQLNDQGIDRINRLRDQLDLLNGSATEAEIAMREMSRAGFTQEQIDEVGRLTDQIEGLKQESKLIGNDSENAQGVKRRDREVDTGAEAVLKGSSSALSSIFGAGRKLEDRTAKATETTVQELKKMNGNVAKLLHGGNQIVAGGKL